MTSEIKIFKHPEFGSIRAVEQDGEPWVVAKDIAEGLVTSSINMDGHLVFTTWDELGLIFEMDDEGHLIVRYNEA